MSRKVFLGKKIIASANYSDNPLVVGHGLRFSKPLKKGEGLLMKIPFESRIGAAIDMFFVFFPIDVVWINSKNRIVDIRRNVKPWRVATPKDKALYVLEMMNNSTKSLKIGDRLRF